MVARVRRSPTKNRKKQEASAASSVEGAPLEPTRYVERELTRPDGSTVTVKVPVYPPFQLKERKAS